MPASAMRLARRRRRGAGAARDLIRLAQPDVGRARGDRPGGSGLLVGAAGVRRGTVVLARRAVALDRAEHRADLDRGAVLDPIAAITPAAGAGTSSVTLSVSSSTSGSSPATVSPTFLNHWPTVASVTDSPRVGTRISVAIVFLSSVLPARLCGEGFVEESRELLPDACTSVRSPSRPRPAGRHSAAARCSAPMLPSTHSR